jgi:hypothetical protein
MGDLAVKRKGNLIGQSLCGLTNERPVEVKRELAKILMVADNAVVAAVAEAVQGSILLDNVPDHLPLVTP